MVVCYLCKSSKDDDIQYGELLQNKNMAVHTFCLYLSSNLSQNGADDEGFLGFLESDIKKETRRVASLHCCYCRKAYANVGCCNIKCRHAFHFICGLENGAENQFCGNYQSFCHQHLQKSKKSKPAEDTTCLICYDNVITPGKPYSCVAVIEAPCCRNGWFHKMCLQRFAKTAGYFFKCPLCNDSKIFRQKLPKEGIFIPNRDAAWELEPNAFAELLERPNECSASDCQCKQGRTHSTTSNPLVFCSTCGSTALHRRCIPNHARYFHCSDCTVNMQHDSGRESLQRLDRSPEDDDVEIDVCNVEERQDMEIIEGLLAIANNNSTEDSLPTSDDEEVVKVPQRRSSRLSSSSSTQNDKNTKSISPLPSTSSEMLQDGEVDKLRNRTISSSSSSSSSSPLDYRPLTQRRKRNSADSRIIKSSTPPEIDILDLQQINSKQTIAEGERTHSHSRKISNTIRSSIEAISSDDETDTRCRTPESLGSGKTRPCPSRKKRSIITISDDEVEIIAMTTAKNMSDTTNNDEDDTFVLESCKASESDDSDDDPVENFTKILEREKRKSFVAQRTRNRSENQQKDQLMQNQNNSIEIIKNKNPQNERSNQNDLNISCIAKRTRRRSINCENSEAKQNSVGSPIAIQRRQTVCSETPTEKNKLKERRKQKRQDNEEFKSLETVKEIPDYRQISSCLYNISQIYEKQVYSDDDSNQGTNNLEISCIAKRTRKRKLGQNDKIFEIDDSSCSSTTSNSSYKTAITDIRPNRLKARSCSKLSEDRENSYQPSLSRETLCSEKWPNMNYDNAYVGKKHHLSNYHSNNVYHPHISNRKRV